jgi:CheY-like chemotaxis protein
MGGSGSNPSPGADQPSASLSLPEAGARPDILIVEDNAADVYLIEAAIRSASISAELHVVKDGEQAIRFLDDADENAAPSPTLVVLDINLPKKQGGEVLEHMRASRRCSKALVIAVSTSDSSKDREEMARLGANGYFHKPSAYQDFMKLGDAIKILLGSVA